MGAVLASHARVAVEVADTVGGVPTGVVPAFTVGLESAVEPSPPPPPLPQPARPSNANIPARKSLNARLDPIDWQFEIGIALSAKGNDLALIAVAGRAEPATCVCINVRREVRRHAGTACSPVRVLPDLLYIQFVSISTDRSRVSSAHQPRSMRSHRERPIGQPQSVKRLQQAPHIFLMSYFLTSPQRFFLSAGHSEQSASWSPPRMHSFSSRGTVSQCPCQT